MTGPLDRHYFKSIYLRDPDGTIVEIATDGPGWTIDEPVEQLGREYREPPPQMIVNNRDEARIDAETWPDPVPAITAGMALRHGMHHITAIGSSIERTHAFLAGLLGLRRVKMTSNFDDPNSAHWYWGVGDGAPARSSPISNATRSVNRACRWVRARPTTMRLAVPSDGIQLQFREKLLRAGYRVSPVMDRIYFKSIYTNDPDGHIFELATAGPGFGVDEPVSRARRPSPITALARKATRFDRSQSKTSSRSPMAQRLMHPDSHRYQPRRYACPKTINSTDPCLLLAAGAPLEQAATAMIMLHGRGATAQDILGLVPEWNAPDVAFLAPQAANNTWYPNRFIAPLSSNEPWFSSALRTVAAALARAHAAGIVLERTLLLGFSQGGCLALEYGARHPQRYGAVIGLSAALVENGDQPRSYEGTFAGTPVLLGCK